MPAYKGRAVHRPTVPNSPHRAEQLVGTPAFWRLERSKLNRYLLRCGRVFIRPENLGRLARDLGIRTPVLSYCLRALASIGRAELDRDGWLRLVGERYDAC